LSERERAAILKALTPKERDRLQYLWEFWARPKQLAPEGDWRVWLLCAGRGFGKTRVGAEWVRKRASADANARIALVAPTAADVRDVVVEGESGILAVSPPSERPLYEPSKRRLSWPNGAIATLYSADEPDRLRGPQHSDAWADELSSWRYPEAWDQLQFGLRLGLDPRIVVTTTPRPTPLIKDLIASPSTFTTRGTTYENAANLAPVFLESIERKYAQTRLGRQEIFAEVLSDNPGALFFASQIERLRVRRAPRLLRIVVAIDPAVSNNPTSDETGIVVVGLGVDMHAYVLADLSGRYTPAEWARRAVVAFHHYQADRIVAEVNQGGALVESNLRTVDPRVPFKAVRASRGKAIRAEPVAGLYEQGRVHHVGVFAPLEDQMCSYDPLTAGSAPKRVKDSRRDPSPSAMLSKSPDRFDALVWGVTEVMVEAQPSRRNFTHLPPG
jgi:phage terminase large subunit-like protein